MKTIILKTIKKAFIILLACIGLTVALSILKVCLPTAVYVVIVIIGLLAALIAIAYPQPHYWVYTLVTEGCRTKGVVKTIKDKFPLQALEKIYPDLEKALLINVYEIDEEDYTSYLKQISEEDFGEECENRRAEPIKEKEV